MPNNDLPGLETYGACRCGQIAVHKNNGDPECQGCHQRRIESLGRNRIANAIRKPLARKNSPASAESRQEQPIKLESGTRSEVGIG